MPASISRGALAAIATLAACSHPEPAYVCKSGRAGPHCAALAAVPRWPWQLVATVAHDASSFTEGLTFVGPRLFESSGQRSRLLEVDPATGATRASLAWPGGPGDPVFGEGLASDGARLVQLSWKTQAAWTWDVATLARGPVLRYEGEGWGLCFDGARYWRSDGSATLTAHDAATFAPTGDTLDVTAGGQPITDLNELECWDGAIVANVWHTPYAIRIDAATGAVTGVLDLTALVDREGATGAEHVLNGLAWDAAARHLHVTGKLWRRRFVIALAPPP